MQVLGFRCPERVLEQANPCQAMVLEQGYLFQVQVQVQDCQCPVQALAPETLLGGFAMDHRRHRRRTHPELQPA